MWDNSGKNISLQGIAKHPDADETAKAHIHIAMWCELTAVFLRLILFGDFRRVQKAVALSTIFQGAKVVQIGRNTKQIEIYSTCTVEKWLQK